MKNYYIIKVINLKKYIIQAHYLSKNMIKKV